MREKFDMALKDAQKNQDKVRIAAIRLIKAAIKDRDIAQRGAGRDPVSDEEISMILTKMIKQRMESAAVYENACRIELAEQEKKEIEIIREFLPAQLCNEDVSAACAQIVEETGAKGLRDMGRCMSVLKQRFPGQMDFSKASGVVRGMLK